MSPQKGRLWSLHLKEINSCSCLSLSLSRAHFSQHPLLSFHRKYHSIYLYTCFLFHCLAHNTFSSEKLGTMSVLFTGLHQDLGFTRHLGHSYCLNEPVLHLKPPCRTPMGNNREKIQIAKHMKRHSASFIVREMHFLRNAFWKVAFKSLMILDNQILLNVNINWDYIFEDKLSTFIKIQIACLCPPSQRPPQAHALLVFNYQPRGTTPHSFTLRSCFLVHPH